MASYNRRCGPGRSDGLRMGQVGRNEGPGRSHKPCTIRLLRVCRKRNTGKSGGYCLGLLPDMRTAARIPQMTRALAAVLLSMLMAGCTAVRLAWRASPTDCRDAQGVHVPCHQAWP